ncbi:hypothetical protein H4S02_004593 [Coemansia sp. RSA 2611]|nr:hypothetical protein IWW54_000393 [Coemansia sp. RSA 2705]KAJ2384909.1 hypothetical protein H4S02_004593 [Coemansia sp. RSA 2611]KAJ2729796.1 hypothetical protein H4R23_003428 [Coemansia sp. Cherry 401B]
MAQPAYLVFRGCLIDTPALGTLRIRANGALGVDRLSGRIIGVEDDALGASAELVSAWIGQAVSSDQVSTTDLSADQFLMPGLIDTHTHAPQFTFLGLGHDLPLMDWLEKYTFKHESQFKDPELARTFYKTAIARVVRNGVTFAAYYGTIHLESNCILADTIRTAGQRAFVGKVCMDANSPDYYCESTEESIQMTEQFVQAVLDGRSADDNDVLVKPIITPRFVPTCSDQCLRGLGALAQKYRLPVQSHLCENPDEIAFAKSCFPGTPSYSHIYHASGLFDTRTIMAHCVHMSDSDIQLVRQCGVGVSHCPNSNFSLSSGIADVRRFLREGIPVGLGTDVGGGYAPSILDAMRMAAAASRALIASRRDTGAAGADALPLDANELLFLATMGGARVMGMQEHLGSLDQGKLFDALVVDLAVPASPVPSAETTLAVNERLRDSPTDAWKLRAEQFVFLADDRNISRVYVGGNLIHSL